MRTCLYCTLPFIEGERAYVVFLEPTQEDMESGKPLPVKYFHMECYKNVQKGDE